jgi:hypothetical protein
VIGSSPVDDPIRHGGAGALPGIDRYLISRSVIICRRSRYFAPALSADQYTDADHQGPSSVISLAIVMSRMSEGEISRRSISAASRLSNSGRSLVESSRALEIENWLQDH